MIKECNILMWNDLVMVVNFEGKHIQMPSTKINTDKIFIKLENNRYSIASNDEYKQHLEKDKTKIKLKKEVVIND